MHLYAIIIGFNGGGGGHNMYKDYSIVPQTLLTMSPTHLERKNRVLDSPSVKLLECAGASIVRRLSGFYDRNMRARDTRVLRHRLHQ